MRQHHVERAKLCLCAYASAETSLFRVDLPHSAQLNEWQKCFLFCFIDFSSTKSNAKLRRNMYEITSVALTHMSSICAIFFFRFTFCTPKHNLFKISFWKKTKIKNYYDLFRLWIWRFSNFGSSFFFVLTPVCMCVVFFAFRCSTSVLCYGINWTFFNCVVLYAINEPQVHTIIFKTKMKIIQNK